jgi:hypothetical protein
MRRAWSKFMDVSKRTILRYSVKMILRVPPVIVRAFRAFLGKMGVTEFWGSGLVGLGLLYLYTKYESLG